MRNPEARHKAHTLHHTARLIIPVLDRVVAPRVSAKRKRKRERERDAAGAAAAGGT